jgi:hypothetical protein
VQLLTNDLQDWYKEIITNGTKAEDQVRGNNNVYNNASILTLDLAKKVRRELINSRFVAI